MKYGDLISREEAIKIASGYCHPANIADELAKLPSAQLGCKGCRQIKIHCFDCKRKATDWYKGEDE